MSRSNIVWKDEKRFLFKDPDSANPGSPDGTVIFGVLETKLENPDPKIGPCLFQLVVQQPMLTRKQLEGVRDCIQDALEGVSEGRIVPVPPGTRIGNPRG